MRLMFNIKEIKYNKRLFPQISLGIGQFMYMMEFLSHLSIVVNVSIIYFTSTTFSDFFISRDEE